MLVIMQMYRVRTTDGQQYVHSVQGTNYLTFVRARDKPYALLIPEDTATTWLTILQSMSDQGLHLELVQ